MEITQVKIRQIFSDRGRLKAMVSIVIDEAVAIHDIRVIEGQARLFVAMPSKSVEGTGYFDIVHPIDAQTRKQIEDAVLDEYYSILAVQDLEERTEEEISFKTP